ncbi:tetratricopeptide repeat protein [Limibacillus sp. MBR-115]|jgi:Flp pilus assembly protein TadD|uniref:tetratricopeptide repeat protein n=1 Tax=Limibacillus sp. MBR-115 TaxID=3156465 RepID=UPI003391F22A
MTLRPTEASAQTGNRSRLAVALIPLAALILSGCLTSEPEGPPASQVRGLVKDVIPPGDLDRSDELLADGRVYEAQQEYARVLQDDPSNPRAIYGFAETLLQTGQLDAARKHFASIVGDPEYGARALQGEGLILLVQGELGEARARLELAVQRDPGLWRAWNGLGRAKDAGRDWVGSSEAYTHAMELVPRSPVPVNNLGMSKLLQEQYVEAENTFRLAIDLDPKFVAAQNNLKLAIAWQGRYVEALMGVSPENLPEVMNNVGYVAMLRGDYDVAGTYFNRALDLSPAYHAQAAENLRYLESLRNSPVASAQ